MKRSDIRENMNEAGAIRLKATIEKYWRDHGRVVKCRIEREQWGGEGKYIYYVRSNLGLYCPPRVPEPPPPRVRYVVHGVAAE